jgi:hypothetical protein
LTVMKRIVGGADWLAGSRSRPAVVITPQARIRMPSQTRRRTTMLTPHPGRLEEGPPVAAMIDCSPPLVNRSDGARTHGYCCGLWIAAGPGTRESQPGLSRGTSAWRGEVLLHLPPAPSSDPARRSMSNVLSLAPASAAAANALNGRRFAGHRWRPPALTGA